MVGHSFKGELELSVSDGIASGDSFADQFSNLSSALQIDGKSIVLRVN